MTSEQFLAELQALLERHRGNEALYKEKVKEISLTRGKISDQLEMLQQSYDKKLKGLEHKLEILKTQNDNLIRENALCKSEIESYQSRLLEKEKIIALLLNQRKDLPLAGSEKSKSDKTDSLNANEEEGKSFKKQGGFKEDYEHQVVEKIKEESADEREKSVAEARVDKQLEPTEVRRAVPPPKRKTPPPPAPAPLPVKAQQVIEVAEPVQEQTHVQPQTQPVHVHIPVPVRPPPPSQKAKPRKNPPPTFQVRRYETNEHESEEPVFEASDFFKNLSSLQREEVVVQVVETYPQPQTVPTHEQVHEQEPQIPHEEYIEYEQIDHAPQQPIQQENPFPHPQQSKAAAIPQPIHQQPQEQPSHQQSSIFLSHFQTHNYSQNFYQPYQKVKKGKAKGRIQKSVQMQHQVSGSDFFNQLSKAQNEPHHNLQIEQSSIDHIDRDNSLMSNEQPYFAEEVVKPKAVKMPKKKMKRDQIKMMDPSCFE